MKLLLDLLFQFEPDFDLNFAGKSYVFYLLFCFFRKTGATTGCGFCKGGFNGDECGGVWKHSILNISSVTLVPSKFLKSLSEFT